MHKKLKNAIQEDVMTTDINYKFPRRNKDVENISFEEYKQIDLIDICTTLHKTTA